MVFCWAVSVYVVLLQCVYFTLGGRVAVFGGVYEAGRVVNVVVGDVSMAIFVCRLLLCCVCCLPVSLLVTGCQSAEYDCFCCCRWQSLADNANGVGNDALTDFFRCN